MSNNYIHHFPDPILDNCILYGYRGSIAHGLKIDEGEFASDDSDTMGVYVPPLDNIFGLKELDTKEIKYEEYDIVYYNIKKFFSMLINCNPNVMFFLWNDPSMFITIDPVGQMILDNKELFSSQRIRQTFIGYGISQLKKMTSGTYNGYMGEKRKKVFDKYTYDTKNASHMIRILTCGLEFLQSGKLQTLRTIDNQHLIDIKKGKWSLGAVESDANILIREIESTVSPLPETVDFDKCNELLIKCMCKYHNIHLWTWANNIWKDARPYWRTFNING